MSRSNISPLIKAQVEKLMFANRGNPLIYSSAPVITTKKSIQTNLTSTKTSITTDQMSSVVGDLLNQTYENETASLPILESTCHRLEHSAARDRIAVKNKRRQAIKEKLVEVEVKETETNPISEEEEEDDDDNTKAHVDKQQPFIDLKDLDFARSRLRPCEPSSIQRTTSFKHSNDDSQTHIYDNFNFYKPQQNVRLRPVSMYIPTLSSSDDDNETVENKFKQLEKTLSKEKHDIPSMVIEESIEIPATAEQTSVVKNNHKIETPNRRRTVGGVNLMGNKKIASEEEEEQQQQQPKPSWIEIAKQKQTKFQSKLIAENSEAVVITQNEIINSSTEGIRTNRMSMYQQHNSPTRVIERDSIRALKAANPNRINNLIQLFDRV